VGTTRAMRLFPPLKPLLGKNTQHRHIARFARQSCTSCCNVRNNLCPDLLRQLGGFQAALVPNAPILAPLDPPVPWAALVNAALVMGFTPSTPCHAVPPLGQELRSKVVGARPLGSPQAQGASYANVRRADLAVPQERRAGERGLPASESVSSLAYSER